VIRSNTFVGGTDTVAITTGNSGGASGDAFSAIQGTLCVYSVTQQLDGLAMQVAEPGTFATASCNWTTLGSLTTDLWARTYLWIPSAPATGLKIIDFRTSAAAASGFLFLETSGKVNMLNAAQTGVCIGTVNVALSQWVRIECRIRSATSSGQLEWRLFNSPDSTTADDTSSNSVAVLGANTDAARFGANTATGPITYTYYMARVAVSDVGWIGPAGSVSPPAVQVPVVYPPAKFGPF
jgi:hypothetical protein